MNPKPLAIAIAAALACRGAGPTQPPPPPQLASVELVTLAGQVHTGQAVSGRSFVARVLDASGAVVPPSGYTISASASPGWTVRGDTVVAPASEAEGAVRLTATAVGDPVTSAPLSLGSVYDLKALAVSMSPVTCGGVAWALQFGPQQFARADSVQLAFAVDSLVVYSGTVRSDTVSVYSADWHGLVFYRVASTIWYQGRVWAGPFTGPPLATVYSVVLQRPDTLWLPRDSVPDPVDHFHLDAPALVDLSTGLPRWHGSPTPFCDFPGVLDSVVSRDFVLSATVAPLH